MPRSLPTLTPLPLNRRRDPFDHRDWLFELKLDGFRALAYIEHGKARLVSRNGNSFKRFAPLAAEIAGALRGVRNAILDGEVVCLDGADGAPSSTRSSTAAVSRASWRSIASGSTVETCGAYRS